MQGDPLGWTWRSVKLTSVYQNMAISEERLRLSNIGATAAINLADGPRLCKVWAMHQLPPPLSWHRWVT